MNWFSCEKRKKGGFIPRSTDSPKDKVDMTIRDMQGYNRSLIENETNLSDLIEGAVKGSTTSRLKLKKMKILMMMSLIWKRSSSKI